MDGFVIGSRPFFTEWNHYEALFYYIYFNPKNNSSFGQFSVKSSWAQAQRVSFLRNKKKTKRHF